MSNFFLGILFTTLPSFALYIILSGKFGNATTPQDNIVFAIILAIFICIGIVLLINGIKRIIKDKKTDIHGKETYGVLINMIKPPARNGYTGHEIPPIRGDILVFDDGNYYLYSQCIGYGKNEHYIGEYFVVKIFEDDINIIGKIASTHVPPELVEKLNYEYTAFPNLSAECGVYNDSLKYGPFDGNIAILNGVKYIRNNNKTENTSNNLIVDSEFDKF